MGIIHILGVMGGNIFVGGGWGGLLHAININPNLEHSCPFF